MENYTPHQGSGPRWGVWLGNVHHRPMTRDAEVLVSDCVDQLMICSKPVLRIPVFWTRVDVECVSRRRLRVDGDRQCALERRFDKSSPCMKTLLDSESNQLSHALRIAHIFDMQSVGDLGPFFQTIVPDECVVRDDDLLLAGSCAVHLFDLRFGPGAQVCPRLHLD